MKFNILKLKKGDVLYSSTIAFLGMVLFTGLIQTIINVQQFGWQYTKIWLVQGGTQYYFENVDNRGSLLSLGFFMVLIFILLYSYRNYKLVNERGAAHG